MKSVFTTKTATAMIAIAVSLSLMSFSEKTYVPADLGSSHEVVLLNVEDETAVDQALVTAAVRLTVRATRAAVNYTRVTIEATRAYTPEVDRLLLTSSTYTTFAQPLSHARNPEEALSKAIKTKMKALG
jgi:hypothetical protein